jgi:hypothetical protein
LVFLEGLSRRQLRNIVSSSVSLLNHSIIHAEAFAVSLSNILSGLELEKIERARKVVADPTMAEIIQEYPRGDDEYENAVRFHIISFTQRVSVSLVILDKLMDILNGYRFVNAN